MTPLFLVLVYGPTKEIQSPSLCLGLGLKQRGLASVRTGLLPGAGCALLPRVLLH